jgi:hypothetical protein
MHQHVLALAHSTTTNASIDLIASGVLTNMQGTLGHAAWVRESLMASRRCLISHSQRWLFWIEGAATCAIALLMAAVLPDFPSNSRFLSPVERRLAELRMEEDAGEKDTGENDSTIRGLKLAVMDWQVW